MTATIPDRRKVDAGVLAALRALAAPIAALTALMLLVNVTVLASLAAGAGTGQIAFFTCLDPDRLVPMRMPGAPAPDGNGPGGGMDGHDCLSCCLSTAAAPAAPAAAAVTVAIAYSVFQHRRPDDRRPGEPAARPSPPIRAPPVLS